MPTTIEGTPFKTSSASLIRRETRLPPNSATYTATRMPTGSAIAVAIATMIAVPTRPFAIPPPVSPNVT